MIEPDNGRVVISQCGGFHARFAAEAAAAIHELRTFVTTYARYVQVPPRNVRNVGWITWPLKVLRRTQTLPGGGMLRPVTVRYAAMVQVQFARMAGGCITPGTRIFHAFSSFQERCWEVCDRLGLIKIADWGIAHPAFIRDILAEESERLGVPVAGQTPVARIEAELDQLDRIYVPSQFVADTFAERGYGAGTVRKNRLGVDTGCFSCTVDPASREAFRIVTAGALGLRKGVIYVLEAVRSLRQSGVTPELFLMGRPEPGFETILARYSDCITYMGCVPHHELAEILNRSSVFVLPSLAEGLSRAVMEAMACGVPCIVTPNTGYGEIVTDGEDGFLVPIRDPAAIRERLAELHDNRDLRVHMSEQAARTAAGNTWDGYRKRLQQDYADLLGDG